jgi:3'-phosphoadenosine 5'-phosphosulfate sulfotransferase (PAPS reductase)/FAD synthetase
MPNRIIVALSGGLASGWCAHWAIHHYPKDQVIFYFNDTRWEHPDLYRFLDDLSRALDHPILNDSDGRSVDDLFFDQRALANNRMPFCSRILKAERLKKFFNDGDTIIFGISPYEAHRAQRIVKSYYELGKTKNKWAKIQFPLISHNVSKADILKLYADLNIEIPELYKLGFAHNNCSGGCVRSGKRQWIHLFKTLPDVYKKREETEIKISEYIGKKVTFLKDTSLSDLREKTQNQMNIDFDDDQIVTECIGICSTEN